MHNVKVIRVLMLLVLLPVPGSAQRLINPSPHFGALSVPEDQVVSHLGVSFDRFTPNGKATDPGIYNEIDRTIGLNFLNYSFSAPSTGWPGLIYRSTVQLGYGHDQPTEFIQNGLHEVFDSLPVESINPRSQFDAVLNFEADYWGTVASWGGGIEGFGGAGFAVGTPNQEAWIHTGAVWPLGAGASPVTVSGVARLGFPGGGSAFPDSTLTKVYGAAQIALRIPLFAWLGLPGLPHLVGSIQRDTGFFADSTGTGIGEKMGSVGLFMPNDTVVLEVWNDYFGGEFKDKGPTGGGRIYVRVPNRGSLLGWLP